ncbi:LexA family protein [Hyphomicrobium sp.]|jgi:DNA polymerase V|uniref:LexA family protein n=1 Tax=Hyphomicrobium sp. TaxID=82 RepID=UPI00356207A9
MREYKGDRTTGFESPARDYIEPVIDLAVALDLRRPHTYPVRVTGQALRGRGIHDGDVLVVNAASEPVAGRVCVAIVDAEVLLATLHFKDAQWWLHHSELKSRLVEGDVEIWAIVEALVRFDV